VRWIFCFFVLTACDQRSHSLKYCDSSDIDWVAKNKTTISIAEEKQKRGISETIQNVMESTYFKDEEKPKVIASVKNNNYLEKKEWTMFKDQVKARDVIVQYEPLIGPVMLCQFRSGRLINEHVIAWKLPKT